MREGRENARMRRAVSRGEVEVAKGGARRVGSAGGADTCCDARHNKAWAVVVAAVAATSRDSDGRTARGLAADARRVDSEMVKDEDTSQIDCGRTYSGRVT